MSDLLVEYVVEEVKKRVEKEMEEKEKEMEERTIKIARNLLQMGYSIEEITEATELDEDMIIKLRHSQ